MDKILNIGIVGCGEIALENLKGIQASGNSKVVVAMDPQEDLAVSLAEQANARSTTSWGDVLESKDVQCVFICTPHHLHATLGMQAAGRGKHVIVEKPLATTLEDAENLIRACDESNVKLSVPYVYRYHRNVRRAKELVERGAIGEIVAAEVHWVSDKPESYWTGGFTGRARTDWRMSKEKSGGGILMMNCSHLFDYVEFVAGLTPVRSSSEYGTFLTNVEIEDYFFGLFRYDNGALGSVIASSKMLGGRYPGEQRGVRFYGKEGQIMVTDSDSLCVFTKRDAERMRANEWNVEEFPSSGEGVSQPRTLFIREFAKAILEDTEPPISGRTAYRSLETCVYLYQSSAQNPVGHIVL